MDKEGFSTKHYQQMLDATRKLARNDLAADYYLSVIDEILETIYEKDEEWGALVRRSWDVIEVAHAYQLDEGVKQMRADHASLVRTAIDDLEKLFLDKMEGINFCGSNHVLMS